MFHSPAKFFKWVAIVVLGGTVAVLAAAFAIGLIYQDELSKEIPPETARKLLPYADWLQGEEHGVGFEPSQSLPALPTK